MEVAATESDRSAQHTIMDLDKFLNLLATIFGALGSIYVMLSIMAMSPELMLRQTQTYWDFSVPQIEALASQKAETVTGVVFIALAFVLAFLAIVIVPDGVRIFEGKLLALALAAVLAGGLFVTLRFVSQGYSRYQKLAMGRIVTSQYLDQVISRGRLEVADSSSLSVYAREFLELSMPLGESTRSLAQRVAGEVGKALPSDLDYSAVEPKR